MNLEDFFIISFALIGIVLVAVLLGKALDSNEDNLYAAAYCRAHGHKAASLHGVQVCVDDNRVIYYIEGTK